MSTLKRDIRDVTRGRKLCQRGGQTIGGSPRELVANVISLEMAGKALKEDAVKEELLKGEEVSRKQHVLKQRTVKDHGY